MERCHFPITPYFSNTRSAPSLSLQSNLSTQHPNSPFSHHPWDSASLCFKFCQGYYPYKGYPNPKGPLDDFRAHEKTFAVIGLLHCPSSPDFDAAVDLFFDTCTKAYPYSAVNRCFALCPNDSQLEAGEKKGWNLTFVPDVDRSTFEFHLNTVMNEMAASLLMEFEKWVLLAESSGTILKTEIDSYYRVSPEELKKRRLGRVQKAMGDYCMLAGSPVDANAHYQIALELTKMTGDDLWYSGAMRGSICAMLASGTSEYTGNSATTENCKKKKSEAKLYEEARFLHKERKCLAEEIANQNATLRALRARNERLKRMKESLADEPQQKIVPSRALISATKDDTYQRAEDSKAAPTELPDLNMLPSEE